MSGRTYRRKQPIAAYLLLLVSTIGSYFVYQAFVVPMVEPPPVVQRSNPVDLQNYSTIPEDTSHHPWFEQGEWERESCSILHTAQGRILFKDFERDGEKTWLVFPFTMVLDREQGQQDPYQGLPPLILRCANGARLTFDQPVAVAAGNSNFQLVHAQLEGQVEVFRKTADFSRDELRIETSNIFIDNDQIITIDDVAFWFGENHGIGRNLTIQLSHNESGNQLAKDFSMINGVTSIRLGILSSMRLQANRKSKPEKKDRMLSTDNTPIEITSAGPFQFDFKTNLAQFQEKVLVRKLDAHGDSLECDRLILQFDSEQGNEVVSLDSAQENRFDLVSMLAQGSPAMLHANSQNAQVLGRSLQYEIATQTVKVSDPNQVQVKKDDSHFVARAVEYHLADDNKLGPLTANGPGKLVRQDGDNHFHAAWDDVLTLTRTSDQQQMLRLTGNVKVNLGAESELASDKVEFALWEVPVFDQQQRFARWSYQPARLDATKNVRVTSKKLIADANSLTATWPSNPRATQQQINQIGFVSPALPKRVTVTSVNKWYSTVHSARKVPQVANAEPQPLIARSDSIVIVVAEENGETTLTDLRLVGNVNVARKSPARPDQNEFVIVGESLRMIPQAHQLFYVQLNSNQQAPAKLVTNNLHLTGNQLFLDQQGNRMWVKGSGRITTADRLAGDTQSSPINTSTTEKIDHFDVLFQGGMIFDGLRLYFERGIVANVNQIDQGQSTTTRAAGTALRMTLDQGLSFRDADATSSATDPRVVQMIFQQSLPPEKTQFKQAPFAADQIHPVQITSVKRDQGGNVIEKLTLHSPHVAMDESKTEMTASGPGSIQIYRRGNNGKATEGLGFVGNSSMATDPNSFTYIQTNFENQLQANTRTNELAIRGQLRSVYALVPDLKQAFDPDRPGRLPPGAVRLNCDRIDLLKTENVLASPTARQFVASGNAHIQSDTFDSVADWIGYRDDTEVLTIKSLTGKNVVLKMRRDVQSRWSEIKGSELVYRLKDKTAEARKVDRVSATIGNGS